MLSHPTSRAPFQPWAWTAAALVFPSCVLLSCMLLSCDTPPKNPWPEGLLQAFLSAPETHVVGDAIHLTARVQGCGNVSQAQVLQGDTPIFELPSGELSKGAVHFSLPGARFEHFYPTVGIAAQLRLSLRFKCEEGEAEKIINSLPLNVSFLPAQAVFKPKGAGTVVPYRFVAVGKGEDTSFIGCANVGGRDALVRMDTQENILNQLDGLAPLHCEANTHITEAVNGIRWAYTLYPNSPPNCSWFSFNTAFQWVNGGFLLEESCGMFAMDEEGGDAWVTFVGIAPTYALYRYFANNASNQEMGQFDLGMPGTNINFPSPPAFISPSNTLGLPVWVRPAIGSPHVRLDAFNTVSNTHLSSSTGPPLQAPSALVLSQNGQYLYVAETLAGNRHVVAAYNLHSGSSAPEFQSEELFEAPIAKLSFSRDQRFLVASSHHAVYFLSANPQHKLRRLNPEPIRTTGLYIREHIHGPNDSLLLLGMVHFPGTNNYGWPVEAIAVDSPENGELWRYRHPGSGLNPLGAIAVAMGEDGQMWMRVGPQLVKLHSNATYRNVRTPALAGSP